MYTAFMMNNKTLTQALLDWYDHSGRELPWRIKGGAHPDPYVILVSEFMLQQTTVKTVIPYFHRFLERFPSVFDLAAASQEEVYHAWQGLGYYTRARSLHKTAQMIVEKFGGHFPDSKPEVLRLKGIGPYTAASFLALAFNQPETVVDGNVIRIICRLNHYTEPVEELSDQIRQKAETLTSHDRPADYASAIMDLGAVICTPKNPQCLLCPWNMACQSKAAPDLNQIPLRRRLSKPEKQGKVYLIFNQNHEILIRKRTEKGLLSGLYELPWSIEEDLFPQAHNTGQQISHVFTHFKLTLNIYALQTTNSPQADGQFVHPEQLKDYALSTLMKKVVKKAVSEASYRPEH